MLATVRQTPSHDRTPWREPPSGSPGAESADSALGELFRTQYESMVGLAKLLVDDRRDAEEIVQEAFVRTYANWDRVRNREQPAPYVRRTVINLARSGIRRRQVARRHLRPVPEPVRGAESLAVTADDRRAVREALSHLPRRQREVVVLRYFLDCSTEETADLLGISAGAVKTHVHRAMAALGQRLEERR